MVIIILVFLALVLMFPRSVTVSAKSELRRPKNIVFGAILIIGALLAQFISGFFEMSDGNFSGSWLLVYAVPILLALTSVVFLKQPKTGGLEMGQTKNTADKIATSIFWVSIGIIVLGALYLFSK